MILEMMTVGPIETSCYIFGDEITGEVIVIDPGAEAGRIKKYIKDKNLKLKCIVNTHGHADHIGANNDFDAPVWIHKDDADFLTDHNKNLSAYLEEPVVSPQADKLLAEGDIVEVGSLKLEVIHTPGHTPGGISLKYITNEEQNQEKQDKTKLFIFTGDTLFSQGGIGRTDFPHSSNRQLWDSINNKLFTLPDETIIYPGHGSSSTIGCEKAMHGY